MKKVFIKYYSEVNTALVERCMEGAFLDASADDKIKCQLLEKTLHLIQSSAFVVWSLCTINFAVFQYMLLNLWF